ncbi:MAG: leucyl/phenylalanyl-tRNA--protein transferase [Cyanobacteriota bacterium]|nr:leucyl/phenylalanyl-tRNA--protein transferase [Cyanobacteriota bacterium]
MFMEIEAIIARYAQGYFPMGDENGQLGWYSSRRRTVIPLDERFRYPRSLRRVLNQGRFTPAINRAFAAVCAGCAARESTWISPELQEIYSRLHQAGYAHSFETWEGERLAGGVLGLAIGGVFIGESMFYAIPDGSKAALVKLVEHLRRRGFILFDAQLPNPHLSRFGADELREEEYQALLRFGVGLPRRFAP